MSLDTTITSVLDSINNHFLCCLDIGAEQQHQTRVSRYMPFSIVHYITLLLEFRLENSLNQLFDMYIVGLVLKFAEFVLFSK